MRPPCGDSRHTYLAVYAVIQMGGAVICGGHLYISGAVQNGGNFVENVVIPRIQENLVLSCREIFPVASFVTASKGTRFPLVKVAS